MFKKTLKTRAQTAITYDLVRAALDRGTRSPSSTRKARIALVRHKARVDVGRVGFSICLLGRTCW